MDFFLQVIGSGAFRGIRTNGVGLRMTDCQLENFPTELNQLTNLTFLFIGNNKISSIPSEAFKHFIKLRLVSLSENPIGALEPGTFTGLENVLEKVILDEIGLAEFPSAAVENLKNLEMLTLNKNSIRKLESGALSNFKTTKKLKLQIMDNELSEIDSDAFIGAKFQLQKLKLEGNSLTNLHFLDEVICTKMFDKIPHIYLMDSPLTCDCDTYAVLTSHRVLVDGTCNSPDDVKNLNIRPNFVSKIREGLCQETEPKCSKGSHLIISVASMIMIFLHFT